MNGSVGPEEPETRADPGVPDEPGSSGRIAALRQRAADLRQRAADLEAQAQVRLDREQERRTWVRTLVLAYHADRNRGGNLLAGGVAYRIFLFSLPAALFLISLFGIVSSLSSTEPSDAAREAGMSAALAAIVATAVDQTGADRWWLIVLGASLTLWAGMSAARALRVTSQIAWQHRARSKPSSMKSSLVFCGAIFVILVVPILVDAVGREGIAPAIVGWFVVTIVYAVITVAGMAVLPHGGTSWRAVVPGALVFVLVIRVATVFFTLYLSHRLEQIDDLYGSLGFAIVLLLWLYVIARLFVGGHFLNATASGVSVGGLEEGAEGEPEAPG